MKEGFRQCMAWLHTWTGLVVGWILLFVFVTGTASYANREITRWMQPEQPLRVSNAPGAAEQFDIAYEHLLSNPASWESSSWTINFISASRTGNQLTANWSLPPEPGQNRSRTESVILNAASGEIIEPGERPRSTAGGRALVRMHYALHYIPYGWAIRIVGLCTMIMFVAIITGVITHKKIFKDFFTFRPAKGQRSWLDAHNLIGVTALPFYLMITYSGLLFFLYSYMPLGVPLTYGFDNEDQQAYYTELSAQTGSNRLLGRLGNRGGGGGGRAAATADAEASMEEDAAGSPARGGMERARSDTGARNQVTGNQAGRNERNAGGNMARAETRSPDAPNPQADGNNQGGEGRNAGGRGNATPAVAVHQQTGQFTDLAAIIRQVESEWGDREIRSVTITPASGSNPARLQLARAYVDELRARGGNVDYDAFTGERTSSGRPGQPVPEVFGQSMLGLHQAQFAKPLMRWLFVVSGILGSAMIATGLVLWTVKRRPKLAKKNAWTFGHMLVEKLNVAAVAGLPFALAMYFWSNRLIPAALEGRAAWEIHSLFIAWLLTLIHSLFRPVMHAWRDVLFLAAAAYLLLPVLNFLTTDRHLMVSLPSGDWVLVSIEAVFIGLGLMFAWATWKVHLRMTAATHVPARSARAKKPTRADPDASETAIGPQMRPDALEGHA